MNRAYVVYGRDPDTGEAKALDVELQPGRADSLLISGLLEQITLHVINLAPGGRMSVILTRGREASDDEPLPLTTIASFTVVDPGHNGSRPDRHTWDFWVERCALEPVRQP
jgi:hypothetical protein